MTDQLFDFIDKYPIVDVDAPNILKLFAAHCQHTAARVLMRELGVFEAVDELRFKACQHGLATAFGIEEVEWIVGFAFAEIGIHYSDIRPQEETYP